MLLAAFRAQTHVSKKLIGDLKMAKAILSWSFLDACARRPI
jgi:hypothetical protein